MLHNKPSDAFRISSNGLGLLHTIGCFLFTLPIAPRKNAAHHIPLVSRTTDPLRCAQLPFGVAQHPCLEMRESCDRMRYSMARAPIYANEFLTPIVGKVAFVTTPACFALLQRHIRNDSLYRQISSDLLFLSCLRLSSAKEYERKFGHILSHTGANYATKGKVEYSEHPNTNTAIKQLKPAKRF